MKNKTYVRVNGRGNAWPIPLGATHPFYDINNTEDLANASFSIINDNEKVINWEVLVDAGHGAIQYLIKHNNRIPEAIVLTHPHHDHTFSIDWIIQSYYRQDNRRKKYPLYATKLCFDFVLKSYPQLRDLIDYKEIKYGISRSISEVKNLKVTPFPVFHGESAPGASILFFENEESRMLFTGDLLCPLLREEDYKLLNGVDLVFADANNRFSYPKSNHWSIVGEDESQSASHLSEWLFDIDLSYLIFPHLHAQSDEVVHTYFDTFLKENTDKTNLCLNIMDFSKRIKPQHLMLVHYSGGEDMKFHNEKQLSDKQLALWTNQEASKYNIETLFEAPEVGRIFSF